MARKRVESILMNWAGADAALLEIGRLDREIEALEGASQLEIDEVRERLVDAATPLQERRDFLEMQLQTFCEAHKDELKGKSRVLNFGTVSFRQITKIIIRSIKVCVDGLHLVGLYNFVHIKQTPDKEKMKELDDAILAKLGCRREVRDVFGYEINREKVASTQ